MRRSSVWAAVLAGGICLGLLAGCGARAVGKAAAERTPGLAQPVLEQETEAGETNPTAETQRSDPAGADRDGGSAGGASGAEPEVEKPSAVDTSDVDGQDRHTHDWQPVYATVYHDEVGHYETRTVAEACDEPVYEYRNICGACGATFVSEEEVSVHILLEHQGMASYSNQRVQTDTIHHDAATEQVWVVDAAAWEEQVVTGFRCACGATQ